MMAKQKDDNTRGTRVRPCVCGRHSAWQDERYGPKQRVWNLGPKRISCTVCGRAEAPLKPQEK